VTVRTRPALGPCSQMMHGCITDNLLMTERAVPPDLQHDDPTGRVLSVQLRQLEVVSVVPSIVCINISTEPRYMSLHSGSHSSHKQVSGPGPLQAPMQRTSRYGSAIQQVVPVRDRNIFDRELVRIFVT